MQMFCGRGRITICLKQLQETLYQISLKKKKETKKPQDFQWRWINQSYNFEQL